jgi:hypothetical protein
MQTVIVAAHRGSTMSGMTLWMIASVVVAALVAFALFRHFRNRHHPANVRRG